MFSLRASFFLSHRYKKKKAILGKGKGQQRSNNIADNEIFLQLAFCCLSFLSACHPLPSINSPKPVNKLNIYFHYVKICSVKDHFVIPLLALPTVTSCNIPIIKQHFLQIVYCQTFDLVSGFANKISFLKDGFKSSYFMLPFKHRLVLETTLKA